MNLFTKPVLVLGNGVRMSGADGNLALRFGIPVLTSWPAVDTVDNFHPLYFGRPGIYGQRVANKIFYEADHIIGVGTRFPPYMIGHAGFREGQKVTMVDVDGTEAKKHNAEWIHQDANDFLTYFAPNVSCYSWVKQCERWRDQFPLVEYPTHDDTNGYMNSYQFAARLQAFLREDEVICVDNGCLMCPPYQVFKLKPPQRMLMAGNLGVMGATIPGAVGASIALGKREILTMHGDGSFMMNVQELGTVVHHRLPIKFLVFENDGYGMIKGTYDSLRQKRVGVSKETGLSFPSAAKVAEGFGIRSAKISAWPDFDAVIPEFLNSKEAFLVEVKVDPEQQFLPRLKPIIEKGKITPARFDQMSPILP